jgi:ferredoxin
MNICYSGPSDDDIKGEDYDHEARVSVDLFKEVLPSNNYDFYMCGPPPMMSSLVGDLEAWGVPDERIHLEAFGPASVKKVGDATQEEKPAGEKATFEVSFSKSGKKLTWDGGCDTLLDFAEENDIDLEFGCRAGNCGSCLTAVKSGDVELVNDDVGADIEKGSCLVCVSRPTSNLVLDG